MDAGTTCEVFVEQDVCVIAIFRDCTDLNDPVREWQGLATIDRTVRISPLYPDSVSLVGLPRSPVCCEGTVVPDTGPTEWMRLDCRFDSCLNRGRPHAGLYLERDLSRAPALSVVGTETVAVTASSSRRLGALWDATRDEGWLGWPNAGLFVRTANGPAEVVDRTLTVASIAHTADAVFAAGGTNLARIDKASRSVTHQITLEGQVVATTVIDDRVLVAVDRGDVSIVIRLRPDTLAELERFVDPGRVIDLAPLPDDGRVVTALSSPPRLVVLTSTLAVVRSVQMNELLDLNIAGVEPEAPVAVDGSRVAFSGQCFRGGSTAHCYYEHTLLPEGPDQSVRLGVPNETRIAAILPQADDGRFAWLAGESGAIHRISRSPLRPLPREVTQLEHDVADLIDTGESLWAVSVTGVVSILAPSSAP